MNTNYISVTEIAGDDVTQEQIDRLCNRYYWAGQYCSEKDVVEVACGTGQGLGYLLKIANSLEAGDYSDQIIAIARQHYEDRIILRQFDAQNMPFGDQSKDVFILFEAIYYLPDAERFVSECDRVLRPGGVVLTATANKDLYDFNPSPNSCQYFGVVELNRLYSKYGFKTEFFGDTPLDKVSLRQKLLRPVKKGVISLGLMPKSMAGKKLLKRLIFGNLITMPAEIGPSITQITQKKEDGSGLYRGHYVEPDRISGREPDKVHKVIYCMATLDL